MKKTAAVVAAVLCLAMGSPLAAADGKGAYEAKCKSCHGLDGKGNPAMAKGLKVEEGALNLTDDTKGKSDSELATIVSEGKGGKMPAFKEKLSPSEIDEVVRHLKSL